MKLLILFEPGLLTYSVIRRNPSNRGSAVERFCCTCNTQNRSDSNSNTTKTTKKIIWRYFPIKFPASDKILQDMNTYILWDLIAGGCAKMLCETSRWMQRLVGWKVTSIMHTVSLTSNNGLIVVAKIIMCQHYFNKSRNGWCTLHHFGYDFCVNLQWQPNRSHKGKNCAFYSFVLRVRRQYP